MSVSAPHFRVLLVCTGNTCRSPLAAAALGRALGPDAQRVLIESAGVAASEGAPASAPARDTARRHGLDLEGHRSRRLTREALEGVDLVLLMDPRDRAAVAALDGEAADQCFGLADFGRATPAGEVVSDPFGGSARAYEECFRRIEEHLARVVPYVRAELKEREMAARRPS